MVVPGAGEFLALRLFFTRALRGVLPGVLSGVVENELEETKRFPRNDALL